MTITRRNARLIGIAAIVGVLLLEVFNNVACYKQEFLNWVVSTLIFVGVPLLPALISLASPNPLRAVGASILIAPWLLLAYYTDCVLPYTGGGASMIYVAVFMWGTVTSSIGALITNPITKALGIEITER
jgi:hypothetical protein